MNDRDLQMQHIEKTLPILDYIDLGVAKQRNKSHMTKIAINSHHSFVYIVNIFSGTFPEKNVSISFQSDVLWTSSSIVYVQRK